MFDKSERKDILNKMLEFLPLSLSDMEHYTALYAVCPEKCAQYSFFALWGWNESESVELAYASDLCWICCQGSKKGILAPIGDWAAVDWTRVFQEYAPYLSAVLDVPSSLIAAIPEPVKEDMVLEELRDEWEYVHSVSDLINLKGNRYAQKRAHFKAFADNHNWEYYPLLPEDFADLISFQNTWRARHTNSGDILTERLLLAEEKAVMRALEYWDVMPFLGALIKVDGKVAAYTIAEELSPDTIDIRFEKAFSEYTGIYQALNRLFLERQGAGYEWVNREEDMGNAGLRNAKLSYHPKRFIKKYKLLKI